MQNDAGTISQTLLNAAGATDFGQLLPLNYTSCADKVCVPVGTRVQTGLQHRTERENNNKESSSRIPG
jgi:hypothetical protein